MKKIAYLLMVLVFSLTACDKLVERGLKKQMTQSCAGMLTDGNLHVVLVGMGGPFPNTERVSVATAVIAGGEFIMVDTGPGTVRNALLQRLPMGSLSAVFPDPLSLRPHRRPGRGQHVFLGPGKS